MAKTKHPSGAASLTLFTIGHSTRSEEEFNRILRKYEIEVVVDVRSFPGSRRYPQFNRERLSLSLPELGISYQHLPALGGRRRAMPNSKNTAWNNPSFRGYADYMESEEFKIGIEELLVLARERTTTFMCAEAVWWRCHRSLIADYLKAMGVNVVHILSESKVETHPFTSAARIVDGCLSYEGLLGG